MPSMLRPAWVGSARTIDDDAIEGVVADYAKGDMTLNVGSADGVERGMVFEIRRVVREIRDPQSGRIIRVIHEPVGRMEVTTVDNGSCSDRFTGANEPRADDVAAYNEPSK